MDNGGAEYSAVSAGEFRKLRHMFEIIAESVQEGAKRGLSFDSEFSRQLDSLKLTFDPLLPNSKLPLTWVETFLTLFRVVPKAVQFANSVSNGAVAAQIVFGGTDVKASFGDEPLTIREMLKGVANRATLDMQAIRGVDVDNKHPDLFTVLFERSPANVKRELDRIGHLIVDAMDDYVTYANEISPRQELENAASQILLSIQNDLVTTDDTEFALSLNPLSRSVDRVRVDKVLRPYLGEIFVAPDAFVRNGFRVPQSSRVSISDLMRIVSSVTVTQLLASLEAISKSQPTQTGNVTTEENLVERILASSEVSASVIQGKLAPVEGPNGLDVIGDESAYLHHLRAQQALSGMVADDCEREQLPHATVRLFRRYATVLSQEEIIWFLADDLMAVIAEANPSVADGWSEHAHAYVRSLVGRHRQLRSYLHRKERGAAMPAVTEAVTPAQRAEVSAEIELILDDPAATDELSQSGALFLGYIAEKVKSSDAAEVSSAIKVLAGFVLTATETLNKFGDKHKGIATIVGALTGLAGLLLRLFVKA